MAAIPIVFAANLPGVLELNLTPQLVGGIYTGAITSWDDPAISTADPSIELPPIPITPIYRSSTTSANTVVSEWLAGTGNWPNPPDADWSGQVGNPANSTTDVLTELEHLGAIGYLQLPTGPSELVIANLGSGSEFFAPDGPQATALIDLGARDTEGRAAADSMVVQIDPTDPGGYPLLQLAFILVCQEYVEASHGDMMGPILQWVLSRQGHRAVAEAGVQPFSDQIYAELAAITATIH